MRMNSPYERRLTKWTITVTRFRSPAQTCSLPSSSHTKSCLHLCIDKQCEPILSSRNWIRDALVFLIDSTHQRSCRWQNLIDEYEDSLFRRELDSLPNDIHKLAHSKILCSTTTHQFQQCTSDNKESHRRYQILLLVYCGDVCTICLLANDL
jgi:hypothetical protein